MAVISDSVAVARGATHRVVAVEAEGSRSTSLTLLAFHVLLTLTPT